MRHRIRGILAALLVAVVTFAGVVPASPARADTACPTGYFCLYNAVNYNGGRWQVNTSTVTNGACWNLSNSTYTDGTVVNDSAGSYRNRATLAGAVIVLYDWVNCNPYGDYLTMDLSVWHATSNLAIQGWYHRYTSFKVLR